MHPTGTVSRDVTPARGAAQPPPVRHHAPGGLAKAVADRYVVLQRGAVVASGSGSDMEADGVREYLSV